MTSNSQSSSVGLALSLKLSSGAEFCCPSPTGEPQRIPSFRAEKPLEGCLEANVIVEQFVGVIKLRLMGILWHKKNPLDQELDAVIPLNTHNKRAKVVFIQEILLYEGIKHSEYVDPESGEDPASVVLKKKKYKFPFFFNFMSSSGDSVPPTYEVCIILNRFEAKLT